MKTFFALLGTMIFLSSFTPFEKEATESREGIQKYEEGDMEQAQEQFEKVSKRLKKSPEAYFDLGNARLKAGKNEEALDAYRKSLETGKADRSLRSGIYHNMGNTFAKMSKLNDAEKMFVKSLVEDPSKETAENLEIVRRMIKQQEQQKKDQQKKDQKEKKDQEQKDDQNKQEEREKQAQDEQSKDKKDQKKEDTEQEEQKQAEKKEQQEKDEQEKKQASAAQKDEKKEDDEKKKGQLLQQFKQRKNLQISPFMLQKESESDSGQTW